MSSREPRQSGLHRHGQVDIPVGTIPEIVAEIAAEIAASEIEHHETEASGAHQQISGVKRQATTVLLGGPTGETPSGPRGEDTPTVPLGGTRGEDTGLRGEDTEANPVAPNQNTPGSSREGSTSGLNFQRSVRMDSTA